MSDFDDVTTYEDPAASENRAAYEPEDTELFAPEVADAADDGWSPVMGSPPPDVGLDVPADEVVFDVPPHEAAGADTMTPPPGGPPTGDLGTAPPPPVTDGSLPPELPQDAAPIDLHHGGADLGAPPMPPVSGDVDAPPPAAELVDLGEGPPLPPEAPAGDPGAGTQSPVPQMGDGPGPVAGVTDPLTDPVDLGDGGPPMPPGLDGSDTTTPPPGAPDGDVLVELPAEPGDPSLTLPGQDPSDPTGTTLPPGVDPDGLDAGGLDQVVLGVDPGNERVAAAAVAGVLLDQMGADEPARQRMIELLEASAADGSITVAEIEDALVRSGMTSTTAEGTEEELVEVLRTDEGRGRAAIASVPEEGPGVFRARYASGEVELESMRTGAVYAASPSEVSRAWRDSGSTLLGTPVVDVAPIAPPEPVVADSAAATTPVDEDGGGLRNVLLAGAVLLPLAGGATFMATRKIR